jgi:hypothetical protein
MTLPAAERRRGFAGLDELVTPTDAVSQREPEAARSEPSSTPIVSNRDAKPERQVATPEPAMRAGGGAARGGVRRRQVVGVLVVIVALGGLVAMNRGVHAPGLRAPAAPRPPSYQEAAPGFASPWPAPEPPDNRPNRQQRLAQAKAAIDSGRVQIRSLEAEIRNRDLDISMLEREISSFKAQIDEMETNARLGIEVDDDVYRRAVASHNALVPRYNQAVADRRFYYSLYETALFTDRSLVAEYNSLIR